MKKILIGLGIFLVVLVAVVIAVPFLIPVERYRGLIEAQVEKSTGREFHIDGPIKLSIFPRLQVELNDVRFANMPGGHAEQMATIQRLDLGVALGPLLDKRIEADKIILVEPRIALEVNKQGKANWQFIQKAEKAPDTTTGEGGSSVTFQFSGLSLKDGRLSYTDLRTGATYVIDQVNLDVDGRDLNSPVDAQGSLVYRDQTIKMRAHTEKPNALLDGGTTPIRVKVTSEPVQFGFEGSATGGEAMTLSGDLKLDVPSVETLLVWILPERPNGAAPIRSLAITSKATLAPRKARLDQLVLKTDTLEARGDLGADLSGQRPKVTGTLETGVVDLSPFMPKPASEAPQEASTGGPAEQGWSEEPIDLQPLRSANLDLKLKAAGLKTSTFATGPTSLVLALQNGILNAAIPSTDLFEGTVDARLHVDASAGVPAYGVEFHVRDVQAEPILTAFANFTRLQGTMRASADLRARGNTQKAIVSNLNGSLSTTFLNGAIKGINIASVVRQARTVYLDPNAASTQKTDFAELSGGFTVKNGTAHTDDLKMLAPLVRVAGEGDVVIPERRVAMRLEPTLVGSLKGQGGNEALGGLTVPLLVTGPWSHPSFTPDVKGIATQVVKDRLLKGKKGGVLGETLDKLQSGGSGTAGGQENGTAAPLEGLRNLFGR